MFEASGSAEAILDLRMFFVNCAQSANLFFKIGTLL